MCDVDPKPLERGRTRAAELAAEYAGDPERTVAPPGHPTAQDMLGYDTIVFSGPNLQEVRFVDSNALPPSPVALLAPRQRNRERRPRRATARTRSSRGDPDDEPPPDLAHKHDREISAAYGRYLRARAGKGYKFVAPPGALE